MTISKRRQVLEEVASQVLKLPSARVVRVAIDGVDGAGKTVFADELAAVLESSERPVIRASVDSFHNPQAVRYRQGKTSPEGFFENSYNYAELKKFC